MEFNENIRPGMELEEIYKVQEEHAASHVGSGSLRVLSTPSMILFMERAARALLAQVLPEGMSSVGVHVDVHHMAPSAVGAQVRARVVVQSLDGSKVNFVVEAWDGDEQIGGGTHQRVVVDEARFLRRVAARLGG